MLSRWAKASFYGAFGPAMRLNSFIHRSFRATPNASLSVQLGPGQKNYLEGWTNVDANMFTGKCDIWADLRNLLPFRDNTVQAMYSHHVVEHLPNLSDHFKDVFRCLQPGGSYRVGGPNGDSAIHKFVEGDKEWFGDFPDRRESIGGRFENFIFCRQEHLTILTFSYLEELLTDAGFIKVRRCLPVRETNYPDRYAPCMEKEWESDFETPHTLLVEAEKPAQGSAG